MPELPEVETVRRTLAPIIGARVTRVWHSGLPLHLNRPLDLPALRRACLRADVERVDRLGKYLLVYFHGRDDLALVHLGMSGRLRVFPHAAPEVPHTHVVWSLEDGRSVRYSDPRRFGFVGTAGRGAERDHPSLARIGVDPINEPFSGAVLHALTQGSSQQLKTFLLDQRKVAGIGNIYAAEALWAARIRPTLRAHRLSASRAVALANAVRNVLEHALTRGGTSLKDFVNASGNPGDYRKHLRVYGREGLRCPRRGCGAQIKRIVSQGRATFLCPRCQHS